MTDTSVCGGLPPSTFTRTVLPAGKRVSYDARAGDAERHWGDESVPENPAITHGDFVFYESTAIPRYLDRTSGRSCGRRISCHRAL